MAAEQRAGINLQELATRLKNAVTTGATAPLVVAGDVARLAENWAAYREEAGGVACTTWIQGVCGGGRNLAWWMSRHEAVEKLGESTRRTTDHHVAVWLANKIPETEHDRVALIMRREQKQNHGVPISMPMAKRVLRAEGLIDGSQSKKCRRCEQLEQLLEDHDIAVPE